MRSRIISLIIIFSIAHVSAFSQQMVKAKNFDFNILDNKVLYIPEFDLDDKFVKRMMKRGKKDKLDKAMGSVNEYNKAWEEAMATSSYDATPYEIRGFDFKKLVKEKNKKALVLLYYSSDETNNEYVQLWMTGPKKKMIAVALINDMDLSKSSEIRLMMNILNNSLNEAAEVQESHGKASNRALNNKRKQNLAEFYERMPEMTFLMTPVEYKNDQKQKEKNAELKQAFKDYWTLSKYEFVSKEELEKRRLNGDPDSYYWRMFTFYTNNAAITYRLNYLFTTEKDEPVFSFLGSKKFKPRTMEEIQKKVIARSEKVKNQ